MFSRSLPCTPHPGLRDAAMPPASGSQTRPGDARRLVKGSATDRGMADTGLLTPPLGGGSSLVLHALRERKFSGCERESCPSQALKGSRNTSTPASLKLDVSVQIADWTVEQVVQWAALTSLPLEVAAHLRENAINGQVLDSLTEQDMLAIGLDKFGWRRQLLLCRQELRDQLEQMGLARQASSDHGSGAQVIQIHSPTETPAATTPRDGHSTAPSVHSTRDSVQSMSTSVQTPFYNDFGRLPDAPSLQDSATHAHAHHARHDNSEPPQANQLSASTATRIGIKQNAAFPVHGHHVTSICTPLIRVPQVDSAGAYLVDNSHLRSGLPGLELHQTMSLTGNDGCSYVPWGIVIYGTPCDKDWVKMGEFFLPMHVNGVPVLTRQTNGDHLFFPCPASPTVMSSLSTSRRQLQSVPLRLNSVVPQSPTSSTRSIGASGHNKFVSQRSSPVLQVVSSSQPAVSASGAGCLGARPADVVQSQGHRTAATPGTGWRPTLGEMTSPAMTYRKPRTQSPLVSPSITYRKPLTQSPPATPSMTYRKPLTQSPLATASMTDLKPLKQSSLASPVMTYRQPSLTQL